MALQARSLMQEEPQKKRAKVIWYDRMKGHGFLAIDGENDLYVHAKDVRRANIPVDMLLKGTDILCNVREYRGRPCAEDLELIAKS